MAQGRRRKKDRQNDDPLAPSPPRIETIEDPKPGLQLIEPHRMNTETTLETLSVPQHLRRARERAGLQVEQLATELCIKPSFLAALENGHYHELPANAYVIGFLRTYSNRLGLNGEAMLDLYRAEMQGRNKAPQLIPPQPIAEGKSPSVPLIVIALLLALLVYGSWVLLSSARKQPPQQTPAAVTSSVDQITSAQPPVQPSSTETAVSQPPAQAIALPSDTVGKVIADSTNDSLMGITLTGEAKGALAKSAGEDVQKIPEVKTPPPLPEGTVYGEQGESKYTLKAVEDCWIVVQDAENVVVFSRLLKAGDSVRLPKQDNLKLTTGNAGGVTLWVDGTQTASFGKTGQIIKAVNLDTVGKKTVKPATKPAVKPKPKPADDEETDALSEDQ